LDQLRHHYIKTLGIVEYVPKGYGDATPRVEIAETLSDSVPKSIPDSLFEEESPLAERVSLTGSPDPADTSVSKSVSSSATESIEFKLAMWQPNDQLLVAAMASEALPSATESELLGQIVQSLEVLQNGLPQFELVQWPPFPGAEGGRQVAIDFVSTLLDARLKSGNISRLLIFGHNAATWLLPEQLRNEGSVNQTVMVGKVQAVVVPSFDEILSQPLLKRDIWHLIKQWSPSADFDSVISQVKDE
jgi:hypothetical protein